MTGRRGRARKSDQPLPIKNETSQQEMPSRPATPSTNGHDGYGHNRVEHGSSLHEEDIRMEDVQDGADTPGASHQTEQIRGFATMEALGHKASHLIDAVNQLEKAGVEASGLPLPKIVAIGDQSSGKSSLIEAISEIRVPRAADTCTRCPIQINLVRSERRSWKVGIHYKYSYTPESVRARWTERTIDLGPWDLLGEPEDACEVTLHSAEDIESTISRAQSAILCPGDDPEPIMKGQIAPTYQLEFSPNVVKLDMSGPNLPTLMLYDLPGIISHAQNGDESLPILIRHLAEEYVRNSNTIVLLACPVGSDHANSNAARLVRELDAQTRTIGVITKPDKLDVADTSQWRNLLSGQKFTLGHGYYVTKQPGAGETRKTHQEARTEEEHFFKFNKCWTKPELAQFSHKFGTKTLQAKLSELLAWEISQGLPVIDREISSRIAGLEAELTSFPTPEKNAYPTVLNLLSNLDSKTKDLMRGSNGQKQMVLEWKALAETFCEKLRNMKPAVFVVTGAEPHWTFQSSYNDPISLDSDDEESVQTPTAGRKRSQAPANTPAKRQRVTPGGTRSGMYQDELSSASAPFADMEGQDLAPRWPLDYIRRTIKDETISGIPRAMDPNAQDALIKLSMNDWESPLAELFQSCYDKMCHQVLQTMADCLSSWASTELYRQTEDAIRSLLTSLRDDCFADAKVLLDAKKYKPFTLDTDVLDFHRSKELTIISKSRRQSRARAYVKWKDERQARNRNPDQAMDPQELNRKAALVKETDLGEDPYAAEIATMSEIRGYYNLAVGNIVTSVGELVQLKMFEGCASQLRTQLELHLGLQNDDCVQAANQLLAEDPSRMLRRTQIESEKAKLQKAKELFSNVTAGL